MAKFKQDTSIGNITKVIEQDKKRNEVLNKQGWGAPSSIPVLQKPTVNTTVNTNNNQTTYNNKPIKTATSTPISATPTKSALTQNEIDMYSGSKMATGSVSPYVLKQIKKNHPDLSNDDIYKMAEDALNQSSKETQAKAVEKAGEFAENHPVAGTVLRGGASVGNAALAPANAFMGLIGKDEETIPFFTNARSALSEGAKSNINSSVGKVAYDLGTGVGDLGIGMLAGGNPALLLGSNTMADVQQRAKDRGVDAQKAAALGIVAGGADYLFNKKGFDAIKEAAGKKLATSGLMGVLQKTAVAGGVEAGENVAQDIVQTIADELISGKNSELRTNYANRIANGESEDDALANVAVDYAKQLGMSAGTGAVMGSAFSLGNQAKAKLSQNNIPTLDSDIERLQAQNEAAVNEIDRLANEIPKVDETNGLHRERGVLTDEEIAEVLGNETNSREAMNQRNLDRMGRLHEKYNAGEPITDEDIAPLLERLKPANNATADTELGKRFDAVRNNNNADDIAKLQNVQAGIDNYNKTGKLFNLQAAYEVVTKRMSKTPENTELALHIADMITNAIDDPNSPYGRLGQAESNNTPTLDNAPMNMNEGARITGELPQTEPTRPQTASQTPDVNKLGLPLNEKWTQGKAEMDQASRADFRAEHPMDKLQSDIDNRIADVNNKVKFADEADSKAYNDAASRLKSEIDALYNSESGEEAFAHLMEINNLYGEINNIVAKGTFSYEEGTSDYKTLRDNFRDATKGTVIKIGNEWGDLTDETIKSLNSRLNKATGGNFNHGIRFSKTEGSPIDELWPEIAQPLGLPVDVGQNTDIINYLLDYADSIAAHKGKETVTTSAKDAFDILEEADFDEFANFYNGILERSNPDIQYSKVFTNTGSNNDVVDMNTERAKELARYVRSDNAESVDKALNRVTKSFDSWEKEYSKGGNIHSEVDVDTAMMISKTLRDMELDAQANGDVDLANDYANRRYAIMSELRKAGTKKGQFIQAFAKWNRTAQGSITNAERLFDEYTDTWSKKNSGASEDIDNTSKDITDRLKEGTITPEEAEGEIRDTLNKNKGRKTTDEDVELAVQKLMNMVQNGATGKDLAERIKFFSANGITEISAETMQKVESIFNKIKDLDVNSKDFINGEMEAYKILASETKANSTLAEKFDAWRYFAMLSKPSTHIRNIFGNKMFQYVTGTSNNVAAMMESAFGVKNRTRAVLNPIKDKALIDASKSDAINKSARALSGSKYQTNVSDAIRRAKAVTNSKWLNKLYDLNSRLLEVEDEKAMSQKYATSLAGYLKANGLDASVFDAENTVKKLSATKDLLSPEQRIELDNARNQLAQLEKAREFAVKQAEYSAFHEDNAVADWLSTQSRNANNSDSMALRGIGKAIEGIVPFKKTPLNILRSSIDYSPLGLLDTAYKGAQKAMGKNGVTGADVIDSLSKTLTGSALTVFGAWMYDKGHLLSSNDEERYQDSLEGKQNYSIKVGGKTYTIDFAAPAVIPLLLGAEIKKVWDNNGNDSQSFFEHLKSLGENGFDDMLNSALDMFSPIAETTMLSGLNDTLETVASVSQNDSKTGTALASLGLNAATGYLRQGIPSSLGALARTIDNTRRSTYSDETKPFSKIIDRQIQKTQNMIPGLSKLNEPYVDTWGREQTNGPENPIANALYQFASPTYIRDINTTDADRVARSVYEETGDKKALPSLNTSVKIDDKKLTPEQYHDYSEVSGQTKQSITTDLSNNDYFNGLDAESQNELLQKAYKISDKIGELEVNPNAKIGDDLKKDIDAYRSGGIDAVVKNYQEATRKKEVKETFKEADINYSKKYDEYYEKHGESAIPVLENLSKAKTTSDKVDYLNTTNMSVSEKVEALKLSNSEFAKEAGSTDADIWNYYETDSALGKVGLSYTKKYDDYYDTYGEKGLPVLKATKDAGKINNKVAYLERQGISDAQKGAIIRATSGNLAKKAGTTDEQIWKYYSSKY